MKKGYRQWFFRGVAATLAGGMLLPAALLPAYALPVGSPVLTLQQAVNESVQNDSDLRLKRIELVEKRISLTEAVEEVRDTRREQKTIRFSLLFNLEFPEKTTLNKEYDLISKAPGVEKEIRVVRKQLEDLRHAAVQSTIAQYTDLYVAEQQLELDELQRKQLEEDVAAATARVALGVGDPADQQVLRREQQTLESSIANNRTNIANGRKALSRMMNRDISGMRLENPMVSQCMPRSMLDAAVAHTREQDAGLYEGRANVELASYGVRLLDDLYTQKWGGLVNQVRPYLYQEQTDIEALLDSYERMLQQMEAPWEGMLKIWLIFIPIRLPRVWFKGSRDGQRYFDDGKYLMVSAVNDRDAAREQYKQMEYDKEEAVRTLYESMAQANDSYRLAVTATGTAREDYQQAAALNTAGLSSQSELLACRDSYLSAQQNELETLHSYNTLLLQFNRLTCGFLDRAVVQGVSFETVSAGLSFLEEGDSPEGRYTITDALSGTAKSFSISLPTDFAATHYTLWLGKEQEIGPKTSVTEPTIHLTSAFSGAESLTVYLYQEEELVGEASVDPASPQGTLKIHAKTPNPEPVEESRMEIGSYRLSQQENDIIAELTLQPAPSWGVAGYSVTALDGTPLLDGGPIEIGKSFLYISVGILDVTQIVVELYDAEGKPLGRAYLNPEGNKLELEVNDDAQ